MSLSLPAQSTENRIRAYATRQHPNDPRMQEYVVERQVAAYRYMQNVQDADAKQFAMQEHPDNYALQKDVYDQQVAGKRYMLKATDDEIKAIAPRKRSVTRGR